MTPEVLPAMLSLRKLRHREHDVLGLFFPDNRDLIIQFKTIPDSKYSASWRDWYLPYTETHLPSVQKLGKLESFSLDHLASLSGTIAAIPASDDHTGISSQEELSASASIRGRTEAADIQETGKGQLEIIFSGNQIFIRLLYDPKSLGSTQSFSSFFEKNAGMIQKLCVYNEVTAKYKRQTTTDINWKVNHCERTEKRNIDKTRKPTHMPPQSFSFQPHIF